MFTDDRYHSRPFVGVVKDVEATRARVRVFGVHPFDPEAQESGPAQQAVSDGDLPWATIAWPVDSAGADLALNLEDWVIGFFADGDSCQMPVITHRIDRTDGSPGGSGFMGRGPSSGGGYGGGGGSDPGEGALIGDDGAPVRVNREAYYDNIPGSANDQRAFNLYATWLHEEKGMPLQRAFEVAGGIVGSLSGESGKSLNPGAVNPSSKAYGIAQWLGPRKRALHQMCGVGNRSLECQLNFSISELEKRGMGHSYEGKETRALRLLLGTSTAEEALKVWTEAYERPEPGQTAVRKAAGYINPSRIARFKQNYQPATVRSPGVREPTP